MSFSCSLPDSLSIISCFVLNHRRVTPANCTPWGLSHRSPCPVCLVGGPGSRAVWVKGKAFAPLPCLRPCLVIAERLSLCSPDLLTVRLPNRLPGSSTLPPLFSHLSKGWHCWLPLQLFLQFCGYFIRCASSISIKLLRIDSIFWMNPDWHSCPDQIPKCDGTDLLHNPPQQSPTKQRWIQFKNQKLQCLYLD